MAHDDTRNVFALMDLAEKDEFQPHVDVLYAAAAQLRVLIQAPLSERDGLSLPCGLEVKLLGAFAAKNNVGAIKKIALNTTYWLYGVELHNNDGITYWHRADELEIQHDRPLELAAKTDV